MRHYPNHERFLPVSRSVIRGFAPALLRQAREEAGLSRGEVARLASQRPDVTVGVNAIGNWEAGRATPQVDKLAAVAAVIGVPISVLVPISDDDLYLADLRIRGGLTQPQLARDAHMSTTVLAMLERGEMPLTDRTADALAAALKLPRAAIEAAHLRARTRPSPTSD